MKKVLFISSTGGHLSEMMQLKPMFKKYNYHIITEYTDSTKNLCKTYEGKVDYLVYGTKDHLFSYIFKFSFNILRLDQNILCQQEHILLCQFVILGNYSDRKLFLLKHLQIAKQKPYLVN